MILYVIEIGILNSNAGLCLSLFFLYIVDLHTSSSSCRIDDVALVVPSLTHIVILFF